VRRGTTCQKRLPRSRPCEGSASVAVVAEEVLGDGVGDDFVHIDADALAGWGSSISLCRTTAAIAASGVECRRA